MSALGTWYVVSGFMALVYYWPSAEQASDKVIVAYRPVGIPSVMLRVAHSAQYIMLVLLTLLTSSFAIYAKSAEMIWMRASFAAVVAVLDLNFFSSWNAHNSFVLFYASVAMVLPENSGRGAALSIILCHQFLSPGLSKIRVGGLAWFSGETIALYLRESCRVPLRKCPWNCFYSFLLQRWLVNGIVGQPWLCTILSWSTLVMQLFILPVFILVPTLQTYGFVLVTLFVIGVAALFGLNFAFHVPAAWIILLHHGSGSGSGSVAEGQTAANIIAAVVTSVMLGAGSAFHLEDWPLNCHGLFSYNFKQVPRLLELSGGRCRFILCHADKCAKESSQDSFLHQDRCLVSRLASAEPIPSIYQHQLVRLVGGLSFGGQEDPNPEICLERLAHWVHRTKAFLDPKSFEPFDMVVKVNEDKLLGA